MKVTMFPLSYNPVTCKECAVKQNCYVYDRMTDERYEDLANDESRPDNCPLVSVSDGANATQSVLILKIVKGMLEQELYHEALKVIEEYEKN